MEWFKLYHEARRDKKLSILTLAERGVWINLLCYASEQPERGVFDASDRFTLALECAEGDETILDSTIDKLLKVRHLLPVACNEYVTSGNESVTTGVTGNANSRLIFRTFASRQAQKVTDFPSDAPERVRERVANHRARRKQAALSDGRVTSVTSGNGTEEEEDRDKERENILSGNIVITPSDDAERVRASAAMADASQQWTQAELRRVSKRIAGRLKLVNPHLDDLMTILAQYPCAPPYLEAEAAKCAEWYGSKRRKIDIRLYDNWLAKAEQRRRQDSTPLAQTSQSVNGHHNNGNEASKHGNGTTESARRAALARETALEDERARQGAEMVRELAKLQTGG